MMLAGEVLPFLGWDNYGFERNVLHFACGAILVIIVLWDHFQGKRYPWTHWAGVFVSLWFDGMAIGWSVWRLFS